MPKSPDNTALLASGRRVLEAEGKALTAMAAGLGDSFTAALRILLDVKGRVVVSGMGKSGHIARKIAATFASTGTPALFVHPGEASHGDLGMIVQDDAVIALSNSGETPELNAIVGYARRFAIPLIAITSRPHSALADAANVTLLLPPEPEICPMGLAPTTSTTMMLALGDALAVATLEAKGFTADNFRDFHPGGKLGKLLLRVSEVMHSGKDLPIVRDTDPMTCVLLEITAKRFASTAVVDADGNLAGIITDGDMRRHMEANLLNRLARDIMNPTPTTIPPDMLAAEAMNILNEKKYIQLLVVDRNKPVGMVHIHDLLQAGIA